MQHSPVQKKDLAEGYFRQGYNCAQSVLLAFCEEGGMQKEAAARLASPFGAGIGRLRGVCGAFSGMCMALGLLRGGTRVPDPDEKARLYMAAQRLEGAFRAQWGSSQCSDLLADVPGNPGADTSARPDDRTSWYYATRPCEKYVGFAAALLEEYLESNS